MKMITTMNSLGTKHEGEKKFTNVQYRYNNCQSISVDIWWNQPVPNAQTWRADCVKLQCAGRENSADKLYNTVFGVRNMYT